MNRALLYAMMGFILILATGTYAARQIIAEMPAPETQIITDTIVNDTEDTTANSTANVAANNTAGIALNETIFNETIQISGQNTTEPAALNETILNETTPADIEENSTTDNPPNDTVTYENNTGMKIIPGEIFVMESINLTVQNTARSYIYGNGILLETVDNDTVIYHHSDYMGSTRLLTDEAGEKRGDAMFLPFGEIMSNSSIDSSISSSQIKYTGKEKDNSYLLYYGARYYDPDIGRFYEVDPIKNGNSYAYVENNPLAKTDPDGRSSMPVFSQGLDLTGYYGSDYIGPGFEWAPVQSHPFWNADSGRVVLPERKDIMVKQDTGLDFDLDFEPGFQGKVGNFFKVSAVFDGVGQSIVSPAPMPGEDSNVWAEVVIGDKKSGKNIIFKLGVIQSWPETINVNNLPTPKTEWIFDPGFTLIDKNIRAGTKGVKTGDLGISTSGIAYGPAGASSDGLSLSTPVGTLSLELTRNYPPIGPSLAATGFMPAVRVSTYVETQKPMLFTTPSVPQITGIP